MCYRATPAHPALSLSVNAPILLPSLHLLSSVAVADSCYWNTTFLPGENDDWPDLRLLLSRGGHMRVKRRDGSGWLTKAARLTPWNLGKAQQEKLTGLGERRDKISFSSHPTSGHWEAYSHLLLKDCPAAWVSALLCLLSRYWNGDAFYAKIAHHILSCLASSCPALVPVWTSLLAQTRLDTSQVSVAFSLNLRLKITDVISCPGEFDCTPGGKLGSNMPASGGWLFPPSA